ncbi:MAG: C1 family peptidase, partial [Bdellovibrionia bacterium]
LLLRSSYHDNYDENCSDTPSQGAVVANASGKSFGYMTHVKNLKHGARVVQYESFWNSKNVTSSINLAVHHLTNPTKPLPIVFQGIWTDEATHATRGFIANPNKNDNLTGGHAVAVVGFISNAQVKQLNLDYQSNYSSLPVLKGESNLNVDGFFIVKNSWGTSKGDGGYFYMPLSYVKTYGYTLLAIEEVELTSFRCPSDTIDQGSSCNYTRAIRGSLPTVCPEGSIQKGLECFQPPPAGYDWTTPGGLLIGKICPVGTNDSGTTCWYDRGVGKLPSKGPCASGQRDDGTSCWEDLKCTTVDNGSYVTSWGNVNCMGGRPFKFLGYSDCYKTWIPKLNTSCSGCGCIKTTLLGRQSCPPDQDLTLGFCYPKPKLGTSCVVTHCSFGKDVKPGVKVGTANLKPNNCPAGQVASRGACYDAPKYGFTCDGASCIWQKASDPLPAQGFDVF